MDTSLVLHLVGGRLDDITALKADIANRFGSEPSVNLRMEISLGGESIVLTVDDQQVVVRDTRRDQIIAQGDLDLARAAIRGLNTPTG